MVLLPDIHPKLLYYYLSSYLDYISFDSNIMHIAPYPLNRYFSLIVKLTDSNLVTFCFEVFEEFNIASIFDSRLL